ncbi:MAG: hypothetical protein JRN61_02940 [Nitrososphaerota archaeon]|nr:hypothetical protein [Nitrososphaerota archaeon]
MSYESFDRGGMIDYYLNWPTMFIKKAPRVRTHSSVVAFGAGASLVPILFMKDLLGEKVSFSSIDGLYLPRKSEDTLFVAVSHSGNTPETAYMLGKAKESGYSCIAISGGGLLTRKANSLGVEVIETQRAPSTRMGFPYLISCLSSVVDGAFGLNVGDQLSDSFRSLGDDLEKLVEMADVNSNALETAPFVVSYYSQRVKSLAFRFRYLLSENAKLHCAQEDIMEVIHNGITAWEMSVGVPLVLFKLKKEEEIVEERFALVRRMIEALRFRVLEISADSTDLARSLLEALFLTDVTTIRLALRRRLDPSVTRTQSAARKGLKGVDV